MKTPVLPRADTASAEGGMFFDFGRTSFKGLDIAFWFLLLYFFIGFSAIDEEWAGVGRFRPRLLLGLLLLLTIVVRVLGAAMRGTRNPAPPDTVTAWWGAYMVAMLLSTLWAFDSAAAKEVMKGEIIPSLLCYILIAMLVRTRREILLLLLVFCLGHGLYLLRSFTEFFAGRVVYTMGVKRMIGAGSANADPNSFSATILFSMPLILWAGLQTRSWLLRLCSMCYGVLGSLAVVLTRSRAGLVLLILTAVWLVVMLPTKKARRIGVVLLVLTGLAASTMLSENAIKRYAGILTGGSTQSERKSTEGRVEGFRVAYGVFKENPVLGIGPGSWPAYRSRRVDGLTMFPHNMYGQLLAMLGIVGATAFFGYMVATLLKAWRERRRRRESSLPWERAVRSFIGAMVFTLFLLLVSGLAAHNLARWAWFWAPGLLVAATTCRRERIDVTDEEETS